MYMMTIDGIKDYKGGGVHVPMLFYDTGTLIEDDFCDKCRYNFYKMGGFILSSEMWDKMRGSSFLIQIIKDGNKDGNNCRD